MIKEFRYRPPIKTLLVGIAGLGLSAIFSLSIDFSYNIWMSVMSLFFFIIGLAMGISLLTIYFKGIGKGNLKVAEDHIILPGRWTSPEKLNFKDIDEVYEPDIPNPVLEIVCKNQTYLIERNWMNKEDYDLVRNMLWDMSNNSNTS